MSGFFSGDGRRLDDHISGVLRFRSEFVGYDFSAVAVLVSGVFDCSAASVRKLDGVLSGYSALAVTL